MYRPPEVLLSGRISHEPAFKGNDMHTELLIDDQDACALAAELVELTGESLRAAVVTALREQIARETARKLRQERIMAITRDIALSSRMAA
jgi:hypothetical protein